MTFVGLDINSTRARAVGGPAGTAARVLLLEGKEAELPVAVNLQKRSPQVGRRGSALCRSLPHLVCMNFLPHVGTGREWVGGRHRLDANRAATLVFQHLRSLLPSSKGIVLAVPSYLSRGQANLVGTLAEKARLPILGTVTQPLAMAAWVREVKPWEGMGMMVDVDHEALTCTLLRCEEAEVRVVHEKILPLLNLRTWKNHILDGISDRCIRQNRRDPRDSAGAEQMIYDQLDDATRVCRQERPVEIFIQATHWFQNLVIQAQEMNAYCSPLIREAETVLQGFKAEYLPPGDLKAVFMTPAAANLPGLSLSLQETLEVDLPVQELSPDASAQGAHKVAVRIFQTDLARDHYETALPFSQNQPSLSHQPKKGISI